jgi:ribose 5-phosphate isomerase A
MKEALGKELAKQVQSGQILAVGTGSTVDAVLRALGERIRQERMDVAALTTSYESSLACAQAGIKVLDSLSVDSPIAWGFDGADEVDPTFRLIKGRGAALLREKILAARCERFTIVVDESKLVQRLGERFPVPIEVVPEAYWLVERRLKALGASSTQLRSGASGKHGPAITERGNLVLDCSFPEIVPDLPLLIKNIPGVIEHGIFVNLCTEVLVGSPTKGIYQLG